MKTKRLLSLLLTILLSSQVFAKELPFNLCTSTGFVYGTLNLPSGKKPKTVVLLIAGSGPTDRDGNQKNLKNNSLKFVAEGLAKQGIASVRFDKRGIAASAQEGLKESELTFNHFIDDVQGWINLLDEDNRFNKIVVAGHSEGALIGLIATNSNPKVAGYISISGSGRALDELLEEQLKGAPEELLNDVKRICSELKAGREVKDTPKELASLFRPSVQPYLISWLAYAPAIEIAKVNVPTLIIQGTTDVQVSVKDADLLASAQPKAKKVIVTNMDHVLKFSASTDKLTQMEKSYNDPKSPLHKDLIPTLVAFIKSL